jgi:hypothetical protein
MNTSHEKVDQEQLKENILQIPDIAVEVFTGYGIFRIDEVSQHDLEQAKLKFEEAIRETEYLQERCSRVFPINKDLFGFNYL